MCVICVFAFFWGCKHMCVYLLRRPKVKVESSSIAFYLIFRDRFSLCEPGACWFSQAGWPSSYGILLPSLQHWDYLNTALNPIFLGCCAWNPGLQGFNCRHFTDYFISLSRGPVFLELKIMKKLVKEFTIGPTNK